VKTKEVTRWVAWGIGMVGSLVFAFGDDPATSAAFLAHACFLWLLSDWE
jgi:hypothetical protein